MGRAAIRPETGMADLVAFLRDRVDELAVAGWHDAGCTGVPGPSGSCCAARAFLVLDVAAKRRRLVRYEEAAARQGGLELGEWWDGAATALWAEIRSDAAAWRRHAAYRPEWKAPA
jgi:hypothetical protein